MPVEQRTTKPRNDFGSTIHRKLLGAAIFFGRTNWAESEARTLGYTPEQRRDVLMQAHEVAGARARIISGDYEQEYRHSVEYYRLAREIHAEKIANAAFVALTTTQPETVPPSKKFIRKRVRRIKNAQILAEHLPHPRLQQTFTRIAERNKRELRDAIPKPHVTSPKELTR